MSLRRTQLFVAFAFTVMADPVSSVAYAIEAALRSLDGDLGGLFATMALVIAVIAIVSVTYHQLIARFPEGGGGPEAVAAAFGEGWAFLPLGALLVDFTLTVAVSAAAASAALIAYAPELSGARTPLALALAAGVAGGVLFGHRGRIGFAIATQAFVLLALALVATALLGEPAASDRGRAPLVADAELLPVLAALPLGMALATGVEAPSNAIAQLPQLADRGRRLFGQLTLWLMVLIVGTLTVGLAAAAVRLGVGVPPEDSTLLAEIARSAAGDGAFLAIFQASSAVLLLAAAASAYLAGSGVLKALAALGADGGEGLLPRRLRATNASLVPPWGVAAILAAAAVLIVAAGAREQDLVRFYAVAVFASFLTATLACARLAHADGRRRTAAANLLAAAVVAGILADNVTRLDPVVSLLASAGIGLFLYVRWVRRGRPGGVARAGA